MTDTVSISNQFTKSLNIKYPVLCGAMYPCSNPELVAAASEAGGIGIIQPVSLVFAHKYALRDGIRLIRKLTNKPVGINILVEKSSKVYEQRMKEWVDVALEEGIRFFVTALGNPHWVVSKVHAVGGLVYHDVTNAKWAEKAVTAGVDGLICVNNRAGGHAGTETPERLYHDLKKFGLPLICAGGVSTKADVAQMMSIGYQGVQMGTRFIASLECNVHRDYKDAIIKAQEQDIVLTEKITGVPVSVIQTEHVRKKGIKAGLIAKWLLKGQKTKHIMRIFYTLRSGWQLKQSSQRGSAYRDYFQAGKSVHGIDSVKSVADIINDLFST